MHRFYVMPENWNADPPVLRESELHHARDVLRLEPGERVVVFNGRGHEIMAEITKVTRKEIQMRKLHETRVPPLRCEIMLAQAIPKGKNMDLIVQKAVELGAAKIAPIISDRTIVHLQDKEAVQKQAKWQQVAVEAAKQCGQNWLPTVQIPRKLSDFFDGIAPLQIRLISSLQSDAVHLKTVLAEYENEHDLVYVAECIGLLGGRFCQS